MTLENTASGEESLLNYEPGFVSHFLYWSPCFFFVFLFCSNEFDFGLSEPEERSGWMHYSVPAMFTILKGSAVSTEAWLRHMRESRKPWSASSFTRHWRNTSTKTSTPLQVVKKRKEHRISLLWWWQLHFQKGVRPASPTLMVNTWVLCISRNLTSWNFFFFFLWNIRWLMYFVVCFHRGHKDEAARRRQQVQVFLPDRKVDSCRGRLRSFLQRTRSTADQTNPQHSHRLVHLWTHCPPAWGFQVNPDFINWATDFCTKRSTNSDLKWCSRHLYWRNWRGMYCYPKSWTDYFIVVFW